MNDLEVVVDCEKVRQLLGPGNGTSQMSGNPESVVDSTGPNRETVDWKSGVIDWITCPGYRQQCATSTTNSRKAEEVRNCLTDEGRPLGTGLQEQVPNHLRRLWTKAMVVSTEGKGLARTRSGDRQEEDRKGTTMEVSKA